jgi:hypothetical protein
VSTRSGFPKHRGLDKKTFRDIIDKPVDIFRLICIFKAFFPYFTKAVTIYLEGPLDWSSNNNGFY